MEGVSLRSAETLAAAELRYVTRTPHRSGGTKGRRSSGKLAPGPRMQSSPPLPPPPRAAASLSVLMGHERVSLCCPLPSMACILHPVTLETEVGRLCLVGTSPQASTSPERCPGQVPELTATTARPQGTPSFPVLLLVRPGEAGHRVSPTRGEPAARPWGPPGGLGAPAGPGAGRVPLPLG